MSNRQLVKIYFPHLSNISQKANIGEASVIHAPVVIHDDVIIGRKCKVQAFAFLCNGVELKDEVFVGPHTCFTNDKYPKAQGEWELKKTIVGKGANIGANSTILPGITIGEGATIGAGSVVTKDVPANETWVGSPARLI
jgi:UDP-2-acetamido-3-amino-2,3-dideoxy-glucuronate N-acetyltransferase